MKQTPDFKLIIRSTSRVYGVCLRVAFFAAVGLSTTCIAPSPASSNTQQLNADEPEAWAMFYFTSVTLFSGFGTPRAREPWSLEAGLEIDSIPHLSTERRTVGFSGTKEEDLNNAPLFGRPRLTLGLPYKLALSLSYAPRMQAKSPW